MRSGLDRLAGVLRGAPRADDFAQDGIELALCRCPTATISSPANDTAPLAARISLTARKLALARRLNGAARPVDFLHRTQRIAELLRSGVVTAWTSTPI